MNGIGRLVKGGLDVIGVFFADHFVDAVEENDLGHLRNYLFQ